MNRSARANALARNGLSYSAEQITGLYQYLEQDLFKILRELEQGKIELAPGKELEVNGL
jgi:hypothetical protein